MKIQRSILTILILAVSVGLSGCISLAPWERGNLAKPQMALDPHPMQSVIRAHNYGSRESGASVNAAGGGGGCGCF
ncbi:MAG: DUF4266 domain-containing protein [Nitrosomonas sp.]|nr:DUF4266 domain-containing protein [Nitrosomonas sp.]MDP1950276.1 DUF4266 domain-containing protein [Nitrosomonas sp.]